MSLVRSTLSSASSKTYPSSRLRKRVLTGTTTAPRNCAPNKASTKSGQFGMRSPTWSPRATPNAASEHAERSAPSRSDA